MGQDNGLKQDDNWLIYFKHKQKGYSGAELLLYSSFDEAAGDLRQLVSYSILANRLDRTESRSVLEQFDKTFYDDYPVKFKMQGSYNTWQVEMLHVDYNVPPFEKMKFDKKDLYLDVLHQEGLNDAWRIRLFDNLKDGKKCFYDMANRYINQDEEFGKISSHDASIQRLTLDQYMKEGRYKWNFVKDSKCYEFDLMSFKVKDLRIDKTKYLDGSDRSILLSTLESYKKNERFFYTSVEYRWANEDEKILDYNRLNDDFDTKLKVFNSLWEVEHVSLDNKGERLVTKECFETASEGIEYMRKCLESDLQKYPPVSVSPEVIKNRFEDSVLSSDLYYYRPRYSYTGYSKDEGEVPVYCDMGLIHVKEKVADRGSINNGRNEPDIPVTIDLDDIFVSQKSKYKER